MIGAATAGEFVELICGGLNALVDAIRQDLQNGAQFQFESDKKCIELFVYLWHWAIEAAHGRYQELCKAKSKVTQWDWPGQREQLLSCVQNLVLLDLDRLFTSLAERDLVLNLVFKSTSLMLESPEMIKKQANKDLIIGLFSHIVAHYPTIDHQGLQFRILDQYLLEEYLADFVAELVDSTVVHYEYQLLSDSLLAFEYF